MAASKGKRSSAGKKPAEEPNVHKHLDESVQDPAERRALVQQQTSNDGRFSTYEVTPKNDPRDGDLILQYRGAPREAA
jgi:hypothetical protein